MRGTDSKKRTIAKTLTDKAMEIGLSSTIMYAVGLELPYVIGLPILIEVTQILTYIINERIWSRSQWEVYHEGHLCERCRRKCECPLGRHDC